MGSGLSQEQIETISLQWYTHSLKNPCLLPDVGIDESLLKYSGINSNTELQDYSNQLLTSVPDYIEKLGSSLATLKLVPNAVGLGALVISMALEIFMKSMPGETRENLYAMFRRVFGEEKASSVRDTMTEYVRRHQTFMNNEQRLQVELRRLETQLGGHLVILRNSLLLDGQMSSRGLKIWVNGASFHVQMLIHEARLNHQNGQLKSDQVDSIRTVLSLYQRDLNGLLETYKTYLTVCDEQELSQVPPDLQVQCENGCAERDVLLAQTECMIGKLVMRCYKHPEVKEAYVNHIFSKFKPIFSLKNHFENMKNNLNSVISQHGTFTLPLTT